MITELRDYQKEALLLTFDYLGDPKHGNPCIVMPTGSGKSWVIAGLCEDILKHYQNSKIIVATHSRELVTQDAEKLSIAWKDAPMGIYSAGLKRKETDAKITFATIQSIWKKAPKFGRVDLLIVDEAHRINMDLDARQYRTFIDEIRQINPHFLVIGLTATPYRMGQGLLTDGENALFQMLLEPVSIKELVEEKKVLAPLRTVQHDFSVDFSKVHIKNGDYDVDEAAVLIDTPAGNTHIVECVKRAAKNEEVPRKHWLFFCCTVSHAENLCRELQAQKITAAVVHGKLKKKERDKILADFKTGKIQAITSVNILTTGFDYPDIDLIAFCRPTKSPGLYVQMAGRGMRLKSHAPDCIVLDFVGIINEHGPITDITPPTPEEKPRCPICKKVIPKDCDVCPHCGYVFTKECPRCHKEIPKAETECPYCGADFTLPNDEPRQSGATIVKGHVGDIMGGKDFTETMKVKSWIWRVSTSKAGDRQLTATFYPKSLTGASTMVFFPLCHSISSYARSIAQRKLLKVINAIPNETQIQFPDDVFLLNPDYLDSCADFMNNHAAPSSVVFVYKKNKNGKKYPEIKEVRYGETP